MVSLGPEVSVVGEEQHHGAEGRDASGAGRVGLDPPGAEPARRLRFVTARPERLPGSRLRISVVLEDQGNRYRAEAEGVGGEVVELRLAAEATLSAVGKALDRPDVFRLLGLKTVHAFDTDLILVAVRTEDDPGRRLVGAVPVAGDRCRTAAVATLDAVNRVVGPWLDDG